MINLGQINGEPYQGIKVNLSDKQSLKNFESITDKFGNVEFILHDFTMMSSNGNVVSKYSNADVMNKYLQDKLEAVYQQLGQQSILL